MILRIDRRLLQNVDWPLIVAAVALICLSFLSLWSLSPTGGIAWRQLVWVERGRWPPRGDRAGLPQSRARRSRLLRGGPRPAPHRLHPGPLSGARRWIHLGPFTFQPSELFKLIFVLTLAWALTSRWGRPLSRATLIWTGILVGVPFVLVVRQPDLGTALVLLPVLAAVLLGLGIRLKIFAGLILGGVALMPVAWLALKEYRRGTSSYIDPFRDPLGTAYNVIQAKIAIGSGQLLGKGVSGATQSRLAFLPERHTDFIFAVFAEMWGFAGCLVLIMAYGLLVLRGFEIAANAP